MKLNQYDDILRTGLKTFVHAEFANIPPENEIDYTFSEKYEKEKAKLLAKIDRHLWKYTNTVAKRVAIIVLCFLVAATSLFSVEAIRGKILEFFYSVFDTYTVVDFKECSVADDNDNYTKTQQQSQNQFYMIANIPEGYTTITKNVSENHAFFVWKNADNQTISFEQCIGKNSININTEGAQPAEKTINGIPCLVVNQSYGYTYCWQYENYSFLLSYPLELGEEYAESIIGKLAESED